jgi:hypothetical protein
MRTTEERRNLIRFKIPGAKVLYRQHKGFEGAKEIKAEMPMIDITKISVRFETYDLLHPGSLIDLEIIIPKKKKNILVKGHIVWSSEASADQPGYAVVQFLPFGSDERYNTMQARDQLKKLTAEYLETVN